MNFYFYPVIIILYLPHELLPIFIHQFPLGSFGPEGRVILPLKSPQHVMTFARKNLLESSEGGECPRPRQTSTPDIADLVTVSTLHTCSDQNIFHILIHLLLGWSKVHVNI